MKSLIFENKIAFILKMFLIGLTFYTAVMVKNRLILSEKFYVYSYLLLVVFSLSSDGYLYQHDIKPIEKRDLTSYLLVLGWFLTLITVVLEFTYFKKINIFMTIFASLLILMGVLLRQLAIKSLDNSFSRIIIKNKNQKLISSGVYNYIRHPDYAGSILQLIAFPLFLNSYYSLVLSLLTIIFFIWRIKLEEAFLLKEFSQYKIYCKKTKRLIPKLW